MAGSHHAETTAENRADSLHKTSSPIARWVLIVDPDKDRVLRLGHWPRTRATQGTPHTVFSLQLSKLLTNLAGVYAPGHPVSAIMIEQPKISQHQCKQPKVSVQVCPNLMEVKICNEQVWTLVATYPIQNAGRYVIVTIGVNSFDISAKQRMQLKRSGFNLRHLR